MGDGECSEDVEGLGSDVEEKVHYTPNTMKRKRGRPKSAAVDVKPVGEKDTESVMDSLQEMKDLLKGPHFAFTHSLAQDLSKIKDEEKLILLKSQISCMVLEALVK